MAEDIFSGYESPQSDTKHQKLLECVLTGNSKLHLGKNKKNSSKNLTKKKWKTFLIIMKLSYIRLDGKVISALDHQYVFNGSLCSARNNQS